LLATEDVIEREFGAYKDIQDHYPKYVVTLNEMDKGIENGIKIVHLSEFLVSDSF
jgi:predicted AAA+ superfamily ATPase